MFGLEKKKSMPSDEYESISKRMLDLDMRIKALELSEVTFRNKVLRKIQFKKKKDEKLINSKVPTRGRFKFGGKSKSMRTEDLDLEDEDYEDEELEEDED